MMILTGALTKEMSLRTATKKKKRMMLLMKTLSGLLLMVK